MKFLLDENQSPVLVDLHESDTATSIPCATRKRANSPRFVPPVRSRAGSSRVPGVYLGTTKAPPERGLDACDLEFRLVETRGIEPLTSTWQR